ncbi:SDR family oxidoreductase [Ramlibacter sp. G-1-2-2]|uniref:SDR family oxidoreductase n=1 Tax=Ramlibacter agri TaxID=2728837 RepID=A0A848H5L9_9BURK|nr:SDR family oxidoreductase [Ramlibacter agri]NML44560.1 SDR family oxidoreductase [Ramlibacter agri]
METGKIALVTGGSRGLGRSMALHLARAGHDVIVTYKSRADEAAEVQKQVEALGRRAAVLPLDVADVPSFPAFAQRLAEVLESRWHRKHIDFLVNNGGFNGQGKLGETQEAVFDALAHVHFKGVYFLTQQLLPQLQDGGGIVCVSSGLTRISIPGYAPYAAMKAAVETLVRYWAKELGPRRIRVNAIAPGAIATDFSREVYEANPQLPVMVAQNTALGRIGEAEDIGPVVAFLCSEAARWVNAQRLEASGGQMI